MREGGGEVGARAGGKLVGMRKEIVVVNVRGKACQLATIELEYHYKRIPAVRSQRACVSVGVALVLCHSSGSFALPRDAQNSPT